MNPIIKLSTAAVVVSVLSAQSTYAVSCPEVKSAYSKSMKNYNTALNKYNQLMFKFNSEAEKARRNSEEKRLLGINKACLSKAKSKAAKIKCDGDYISAMYLASNIPSSSAYELALDTAQRLVLNNKKCFDPILVVEVQRKRGINP